MPLFLFLFPLQHGNRSALQNKQVVILRMAFRARKVLGTFEKRAPGPRQVLNVNECPPISELKISYPKGPQQKALALPFDALSQKIMTGDI